MQYGNTSLFSRRAAAFAVAGMLGLSVAVARAAGELPTLQHQGEVAYLTGGVGVDEARAMKAEAAHHALALLFVGRIGKREHYTAGVQVTIARKDGTVVLDAHSDGPFLLADLPAGTYRVTAAAGEQKRTQTVHIAGGQHRRLVFAWDLAGQAQ